MSAYVRAAGAEFADESDGYTAVKHQAEVGTGYFDKVATALNPNSGTLALSGSTEERAVPLSRHRLAFPRHSSSSQETRLTMLTLKTPSVRGAMHPRFDEILTPEALAFVGKLDAAIAGRRAELLDRP